MYSDRISFYKALEKARDSKLIVYVTGDRVGMQAQIHAGIRDYFANHLDTFNLPKKISLYLYSLGGEILAGWTVVNMIRQFCEEFEVIVPSKAQSTATLICLGANKTIMTKQATLGPIDPSTNNPLNPAFPGAPPQIRVPLSVEAVAGYFELAKSEQIGIKDEGHLANIFLKLSEQVHPVALGEVFRTRGQIQKLAEKLLKFHMNDFEKIKGIISLLCGGAGSHDFTLNRKAALELGLPVDKPSQEDYNIIRDIHDNFWKELQMDSDFNPNIVVGAQSQVNYSCTRALLESVTGGSYKFISEGIITKTPAPPPMIPGQQQALPTIYDQRTFEGWRYESPK